MGVPIFLHSIFLITTFQIQVIAEGSMVTMDYDEDRVRLTTNKDGKVTSTPRIG